jgi:hypothetical protein
MKKWIFIFLTGYCIVGIGLYLSHKKSDYPSYKPDEALQWDVNKPSKGNYSTPPAMKDRLDNGDQDQVQNIVPNERLMSFFAEIQQGDARTVTTYINPSVAHSDFQQKDVKSINQKLDRYVQTISRNKTIQKVELSTGRKMDADHYEFDVTIYYPNESVQLKNIPMIQIKEANNWYIDQPLSKLAAPLEKTIKN